MRRSSRGAFSLTSVNGSADEIVSPGDAVITTCEVMDDMTCHVMAFVMRIPISFTPTSDMGAFG